MKYLEHVRPPTGSKLNYLSRRQRKKLNAELRASEQYFEQGKQRLAGRQQDIDTRVVKGSIVPNKIYHEPDRDPVDKLAASMFWGTPKL